MRWVKQRHCHELTSEAAASCRSSSFRILKTAVFVMYMGSLLSRGAAAVLLRARVSLAISRGAVTLVMVVCWFQWGIWISKQMGTTNRLSLLVGWFAIGDSE